MARGIRRAPGGAHPSPKGLVPRARVPAPAPGTVLPAMSPVGVAPRVRAPHRRPNQGRLRTKTIRRPARALNPALSLSDTVSPVHVSPFGEARGRARAGPVPKPRRAALKVKVGMGESPPAASFSPTRRGGAQMLPAASPGKVYVSLTSPVQPVARKGRR